MCNTKKKNNIPMEPASFVESTSIKHTERFAMMAMQLTFRGEKCRNQKVNTTERDRSDPITSFLLHTNDTRPGSRHFCCALPSAVPMRFWLALFA